MTPPEMTQQDSMFDNNVDLLEARDRRIEAVNSVIDSSYQIGPSVMGAVCFVNGRRYAGALGLLLPVVQLMLLSGFIWYFWKEWSDSPHTLDSFCPSNKGYDMPGDLDTYLTFYGALGYLVYTVAPLFGNFRENEHMEENWNAEYFADVMEDQPSDELRWYVRQRCLVEWYHPFSAAMRHELVKEEIRDGERFQMGRKEYVAKVKEFASQHDPYLRRLGDHIEHVNVVALILRMAQLGRATRRMVIDPETWFETAEAEEHRELQRQEGLRGYFEGATLNSLFFNPTYLRGQGVKYKWLWLYAGFFDSFVYYPLFMGACAHQLIVIYTVHSPLKIFAAMVFFDFILSMSEKYKIFLIRLLRGHELIAWLQHTNFLKVIPKKDRFHGCGNVEKYAYWSIRAFFWIFWATVFVLGIICMNPDFGIEYDL